MTTVNFRLLDSASRPVDGTITVKGPTNKTVGTSGSRASMSLPAGKYTVTVVPRRETAPAARTITVPASGTAQFVISTIATNVIAESPEDTQTRRSPPGKNLARGTRQILAGRIVDQYSRPVDALLVFYQSGKVKGHITSLAARFTAHDLAAGSYSVKIYSRRGGSPLTQTVTVTSVKTNVVIRAR